MNPDNSRPVSRAVDIEAVVAELGNVHTGLPGGGTLAGQSALHSEFPKHREEDLHTMHHEVDGKSDRGPIKASHTISQVSPPSPHGMPLSTDFPTTSEFKPWKADEPLLTKIPEFKTTKEDWVKAMNASDDGMCKGWKDSIDTLIIFAGLFSATVTAFTVKLYQWLSETPADTLARLQLRDMLNATHNPAIGHLAPATFHVSLASVAVNTLWFASLTLSLTAIIISILCKQWLFEYQRYDNFTLDEAFLIRGLRYRGLQAWKVPEIISSILILLQIALTSAKLQQVCIEMPHNQY